MSQNKTIIDFPPRAGLKKAMSFIEVQILGRDVTRRITAISALKEYNDESFYFSGLFRRGNIKLDLDNNDDFLRPGGPVFPASRNNAGVELFYRANNPLKDRILVFSGLLDESSTDHNITNRSISFTILDRLKILKERSVVLGNQKTIDGLYTALRGSTDIRLNKHYIAAFLFYFFRQNSFELNKIFNVFENNALQAGSYESINATVESIFPPSDAYYNINNRSALTVLNQLCQSINSYLIVENLPTGTKLSIKARPRSTQTKKPISPADILKFSDYAQGFNKLFNKIIINNSSPYFNQSSIDQHGVREININSYAPASASLANSYLDYYSTPKPEVSLGLKMNHSTLDLKIGDCVSISQPASADYRRQEFSGDFFIIARSLNFEPDILTLVLRKL